MGVSLINRTLTSKEIEHLANLPGVQYKEAKKWLETLIKGRDADMAYFALTSAYGLCRVNGDTFNAIARGIERAKRKYLIPGII